MSDGFLLAKGTRVVVATVVGGGGTVCFQALMNALARGVRRVPYKQGDLGGLCGAYAIVNALAHLHPERKGDKRFGEFLFKTVIENIRPITLRSVVHGGISFRAFRPLLSRVCDRVERATDSTLHISRLSVGSPETGEGFTECLRAAVAPQNVVAFIYLGQDARFGGGNHWTVVKGVTKTSLNLIDSAGYYRISRSDVVAEAAWSEDALAGKVRLDPNSTILLTRTW